MLAADGRKGKVEKSLPTVREFQYALVWHSANRQDAHGVVNIVCINIQGESSIAV